MRRVGRAAIVAAVCCLLAACDRPPSDADVRDALGKGLGVFGDAAKKDLAQLKVIGCVKAQPSGFKCDWTWPFGPGTGRFVKSDRGWEILEIGR